MAYNFSDSTNGIEIEKELVKALQGANKAVAETKMGTAYEYLVVAQKCMEALINHE